MSKQKEEYEELWEKYTKQELSAKEIVRFYELVDKFQKDFLQDDIEYWKRKARTKKDKEKLTDLLESILDLHFELPKKKIRIPKK